jgi:hypothetical protein
MRSQWPVLMFAAGLLPAPAFAQALAPETRVRVFTPDTDEEDGEEGDHLTSDGTTVRIRRDDRVVSFAAEKVIRVEIFAGRAKRPKGAGVGLAIGAGTGLLAGATYWLLTLECDANNPRSFDGDPWRTCPSTLESDRRGKRGFIGATVGLAALGAFVGSRMRHDTWVEVPLGKTTVGVGPNGPRGELGLTASVRF